MDTGYSILMFIFGGCIFLFGVQMFVLKHPFIPIRAAISMKKTVSYRKYVAKVVMFVSFAPIISALFGLLGEAFIGWALLILLFSFIGLLILGIKIFHE